MARKPGMLEKAARKLRNDSAIRGLIAAIKGGDRDARCLIRDRAEELGVTMSPAYFGYLVAHLCQTTN